jgi:hypothetical protein
MPGPPEYCLNCGAAIPPDVKACPECGADEETGWGEEARYAGLDLPDENFDYDAFVKREFAAPSPKPEGISWFWWVVAIVLLAALVVFFAL